MGRSSAVAARTVTAAVLANPSQAVRFSSAIGSMPWSTKPPARSLRAIATWACPSGPYQMASTSAPATGLPSSPATDPRTSAPRRSSTGGSSISSTPRPGISWGAFAMSAGSKKGEGNRIGQPMGWPASRRIRPANRPAASVVTKRSPPKIAVEDDLDARDRPVRPLLAHEAADMHRLAQRDRDLGRLAGLHDQPPGFLAAQGRAFRRDELQVERDPTRGDCRDQKPPLVVAGDRGRPPAARSDVALALRGRADRHAPDRLLAGRDQSSRDPTDRRERQDHRPVRRTCPPWIFHAGILNR